jgi:hypothetical protein
MTRDRLLREIAEFERRVAETENLRDTRRQKAAHTRARHCLGQRRKMLVALDTTGSISNWTSVSLPSATEEV